MIRKILPPRLDRNHSIGMIAPADPVSGVCLEGTINRGYKYLRSKGFQVIEGRSVKIQTQKYTAGTIADRVKDIHDFIQRDDIGCIMAFWGGVNTNQLLDHLDYQLIKKNPKIFIGYSDTTALTAAITTKTGLITFSGPGGISFAKPEPFDYTWSYFEKMCIEPQEEVLVQPSGEYADDLYFLRKDSDHRIKKYNSGIKVFHQGTAFGEVIVGNLQTLLILQGTQYLSEMTNKVLFIEDDETTTPALFDRFLCHCKQLGWFNKIAGLVIGRFSEESNFTPANSIENVLNLYLSKAQFPVMYDVDFGHTDPMVTIPNGGMVEINTMENKIVFKKSVE